MAPHEDGERAPIAPGDVIGPYRVESPVRTSSDTQLYKATHERLGSDHMLCVIHAESKAVRARLLEAGRRQAQLRHPNLVAITDVRNWGDLPILVMAVVDGPTLADWLQDHTLTPTEAAQMTRGILRGVQQAHRAGLVHRELRPDNILVQPLEQGWVPQITAFSSFQTSENAEPVERITAYSAPEQVRDPRVVDHHSDLYAVGCVLYEMLYARAPFVADDEETLRERIFDNDYAQPDDPSVPNYLRRIVDSLLARATVDRVPSADVAITLIDRADAAEIAEADTEPRPRPRGGLEEPTSVANPTPSAVPLAAGIGLLLVIGVALAGWFML